MGFFSHDSKDADAHAEVEGSKHTAHLSHEIIAAAASFEAAKLYKDHCEKNGKPVSHAKTKEFLAGASGFFVDRLVETKGLDFVNAEKAKIAAKKRLDEESASHHSS